MTGRLKTWFWRVRLSMARDPLAVARAWRHLGVHVGENSYIYRTVRLGRNGKDPIQIGNNCVLTGCTILGHDASTNHQLGLRRSMIRPVKIEDGCFIGQGAIVLMGVTVGPRAIVGAGAVVTKDVPPDSVVAGNPARVLCTVDELTAQRRQLMADHPEYFPDLTQHSAQ